MILILDWTTLIITFLLKLTPSLTRHAPILPVLQQSAGETLSIAVALAAAQTVIAVLFRNEPFIIRRHPNTIQVGRGRERPLPGASHLTLRSVRLMRRMVHILNMAIPGEGSAPGQTFLLASFNSLTEAERAKSEIERFVGTGGSGE